MIGRVAQRGDALSISAELIDVRNNRHLWGEQYNRKLIRHPRRAGRDLDRRSPETLRFKLTGDDRRRLDAALHSEARKRISCISGGRHYWNKKTPDGFNKGIEVFQQ